MAVATEAEAVAAGAAALAETVVASMVVPDSAKVAAAAAGKPVAEAEATSAVMQGVAMRTEEIPVHTTLRASRRLAMVKILATRMW